MIQTAIVVVGLLIGITASFPTLAFASRRIEYDVPVNATSRAGIERARRGIVRAIGETDGVLADPRPDVLVVALGDSAVTLRARWEADARVPDALIAQDRVLDEPFTTPRAD